MYQQATLTEPVQAQHLVIHLRWTWMFPFLTERIPINVDITIMIARARDAVCAEIVPPNAYCEMNVAAFVVRIISIASFEAYIEYLAYLTQAPNQ